LIIGSDQIVFLIKGRRLLRRHLRSKWSEKKRKKEKTDAIELIKARVVESVKLKLSLQLNDFYTRKTLRAEFFDDQPRVVECRQRLHVL